MSPLLSVPGSKPREGAHLSPASVPLPPHPPARSPPAPQANRAGGGRRSPPSREDRVGEWAWLSLNFRDCETVQMDLTYQGLRAIAVTPASLLSGHLLSPVGSAAGSIPYAAFSPLAAGAQLLTLASLESLPRRLMVPFSCSLLLGVSSVAPQ